MKDSRIILFGLLEAKQGEDESLVKELNALVKLSVEEEGCLQYSLHRSKNNSSQFIFYEIWSNAESFKAHLASPHIIAWQAKKDFLLAKPNEVTFWEMMV